MGCPIKRSCRRQELISILAVGYRFHDLAFAYDVVGNLTSLENRALPPGTLLRPRPRQRHRGALAQDLRLRRSHSIQT